MLVAACLVVSTQELFGDRIQCSVDAERDVRPEVINAYCWAAATYSVSSAYYKEMGVESPHPGIGASENQSEYVYRNYYQYVHLVLFLQALLFYLPHLLWKSLDGQHFLKGFFDTLPGPGDKARNAKSSPPDHIGNSVGNCTKSIGNQVTNNPLESSAHKKGSGDHTDNSVGNCTKAVTNQATNHYEASATYLEERWSTHSEYAAKYVFCEVLSVANLLVQCCFLNVFLQGEFLGLGHLMGPYFHGRPLEAPMQLFPLVTSCYFQKFGAPGFVDTVDALCVLPANALNAKIFLFAWVWFTVLFVLSMVSLIDLCACWVVPPYRTFFLRIKRILGFKTRISQAPYLKVLNYGDFGDWFVLGCVRKNMDPLEFSRLMNALLFKLSAYGTEIKEP
ncbi:hypothetical protein JTE90_025955 [Oedothorax gibbosus]|uniref:Innexin n=1 Tax=Oedothorax gibbosus TaxID=931172 RepID=A0AAV6U3U0_9ARAC|nr:hypothetical protein JTE90_025955 [Oedothorax gibbosus]